MNIKERSKTSDLLKEWKFFLNEQEKEKIETVGDLKKILDPKSKMKDAAKSALFSTLKDIGVDLVPGGTWLNHYLIFTNQFQVLMMTKNQI